MDLTACCQRTACDDLISPSSTEQITAIQATRQHQPENRLPLCPELYLRCAQNQHIQQSHLRYIVKPPHQPIHLHQRPADTRLLCPCLPCVPLCAAECSRGSDKPASFTPTWVPEAQSWVGPFIMEGVNARIVQLSNALVQQRYGTDFKYMVGGGWWWVGG